MSDLYPSFSAAISVLSNKMIHQSRVVDSGNWQGVETKNHPEMQTHELLHTFFKVPLNGVCDQEHWATDTGASLPWANEHFAERVCGVGLNPDPSHVRWPWWDKQDSSKTVSYPDVDERNWSYLAAFIDGDGSMDVRSEGTLKPRISIGQANHEFLNQLQQTFYGIGRLKDEDEPNRKSRFGTDMWYWVITRKAELNWVLPKIIPYLRLKRDRGLELFEAVTSLGEDKNDLPLEVETQKFSHTYSERFWPPQGYGIRYPFGNLDSLVHLLLKYPTTRQAYLPIFFPEDTGAVHGGRIPCTLGYHFLMRDGFMHVHYPIRSCDFVRHFRNDCYLTVRLLLWILERLKEKDPDRWGYVLPGMFSMWCGSLHVFRNDLSIVRGDLRAYQP